jgi:hypothetical protein
METEHDGNLISIQDRGRYNRRQILSSGLTAALVGMVGCSGSDDSETADDATGGTTKGDSARGTEPQSTDGDGTVSDTTPSSDDGGDASDGGSGCTPGHSDGDPPCEQIADDATVLTEFNSAGKELRTGFDYPCGWRTSTTDQYDDRAQAQATRDDFDAYVNVQIRNYTQPVEEGFLDQKRTEGNYDDVSYEYDGSTRTALLSAKSSASFGTLGHAVIPHEDAFVHVEIVSTLKADECGVEPRPDYDVVKAMLGTIRPNPDSTFSFA